MKYYIVETDKRNPLPEFKGIYSNVYSRFFGTTKFKEDKEGFIYEMTTREETFIPDVITSPFCMVSKEIFRLIMLYIPDIEGEYISFVESGKRKSITYVVPILEEIREKELNETDISEKVLFYVIGLSSRYLIVRMDLLESILRRKILGLKVKEFLKYSGE